MILEIAKYEMNINSNKLKKFFAHNMTLLYTDTDSLNY